MRGWRPGIGPGLDSGFLFVLLSVLVIFKLNSSSLVLSFGCFRIIFRLHVPLECSHPYVLLQAYVLFHISFFLVCLIGSPSFAFIFIFPARRQVDMRMFQRPEDRMTAVAAAERQRSKAIALHKRQSAATSRYAALGVQAI